MDPIPVDIYDVRNFDTLLTSRKFSRIPRVGEHLVLCDQKDPVTKRSKCWQVVTVTWGDTVHTAHGVTAPSGQCVVLNIREV